MTRVSIALSLLMTAAASAAEAQGIASSYEQLRLLVRPGDKVSIVDANGKAATGRILGLSSSSLALRVKGERVDVLEREVRTIRQRRQDPLRDGALRGASLGLFTASVVDGRPAAGLASTKVLLFSGLGAGIGMGIDALFTSPRVIYFRPLTPSERVRVSPLLTGDRTGARLSFTF
jgi:hypothetical protein